MPGGPDDHEARAGDGVRHGPGLRRRSQLVLVSHDAGLIERTCARVIVLDHGRLVFDGPTAEGLAYYRSEALVGTT